MLNKSFYDHGRHRDRREERGDGAIFSFGGCDGGYGLYVRDGEPVFVGNFLSRIAHARDVDERRCPRAR